MIWRALSIEIVTRFLPSNSASSYDHSAPLEGNGMRRPITRIAAEPTAHAARDLALVKILWRPMDLLTGETLGGSGSVTLTRAVRTQAAEY